MKQQTSEKDHNPEQLQGIAVQTKEIEELKDLHKDEIKHMIAVHKGEMETLENSYKEDIHKYRHDINDLKILVEQQNAQIDALKLSAMKASEGHDCSSLPERNSLEIQKLLFEKDAEIAELKLRAEYEAKLADKDVTIAELKVKAAYQDRVSEKDVEIGKVESTMAAAASLEQLLEICGFNGRVRAIMVDADKTALELADLSSWSNDDVDDLIEDIRNATWEEEVAPAQPGPPPVPAVVQLHYHSVPIRAIDRLKTVCHALRHITRTQRTVELATFTQNFLRDWKDVRMGEDDYAEPKQMPKLTKSDISSILDFIEEFPYELERWNGTGGLPLAYVIREDDAVPAEADDPMFGSANSVYSSVREEAIARANLANTAFRADNKKVFELLRNAVADFHEVKVWVEGYFRAKDGRGAWMAFKAHYLGNAQLDTIAERADQRIKSLVYNGERTQYTYETHVSNFERAHWDLRRAGNEPDGRTKVRKFLQTIKAAELQTAVSVVKATDAYMVDFEQTVNYLRRFIIP